MQVTHLNLTDFRNYLSADVPFSSGANLFVGRNGQGKTNLIEALGYLSTLGSHRVTADHAMIRQNANSAVIRAQIKYDGRQVLAEVQLNRTGVNRAQVNRSAIKIRELPRYFASVLFAPEDLALIRGDPSGRRRFLDQLLILRTPRFAGVMFDFDRVIRQRNSLLKSARSARLGSENLSTLEIWDERLVELGSEIMLARSGLVAELASEVSRAYLLVAGDDHHPRMTIQSSLIEEATQGDGSSALTTLEQIAESFRAALMRVRRSEVERAVTLVGPHRDDLVLELNSMPARGYASHGESWSFALSLKLAAAEILRRESSTGDPVLILDDVFAELDRQRRTRLAHAIEGFEQVLITAAVLEDVPVELTAHTVHVRSGRIEEQHVS